VKTANPGMRDRELQLLARAPAYGGTEARLCPTAVTGISYTPARAGNSEELCPTGDGGAVSERPIESAEARYREAGPGVIAVLVGRSRQVEG